MTQACLKRSYNRISDAYLSEGVSADAENLDVKPRRDAFADNSVTIGQRYNQLFQQIIEARAVGSTNDWDGDGAIAVSDPAVGAAITLSAALPHSLPLPVVSAEPTGEITFEWFKDATHVAVIAVDGDFVRWSALAGSDATRSGAEPYLKVLPVAALDVIREVLA